MRTTTTGWVLAGAITMGCGAFGFGCAAPPPPGLPPEPPGFPVEDGGRPLPPPSSPFLDPALGSPVATTLAETPPPISGGTLAVVGAGYTAVVADPDRDRVTVVDLIARAVHGTIELAQGSQPSRVVEDADGRIHVVLRGTGEILSFDIHEMGASTQRAVCPMPRGIASNDATGELVVACRGGELVTIPAAGGAVSRSVMVERDLRDVVVQDGRVLVSLFRRAELLEVDADGAVLARRAPGVANFGPSFTREGGVAEDQVFEPNVAWRAISAPAADGSGDVVAMVHQRSSDAEVQPEPGGYGGGMGRCLSSIVQSSITFFGPDGAVSPGPDLAGATLPVDVAISPGQYDRQLVAVVAAANQSGEQSISVYSRNQLDIFLETDCAFPNVGLAERIANPTSAAFLPDGRLLVLSRQPGELTMLRFDELSAQLVRDALPGRTDAAGRGTITVGAEARFDTGHSVFHGNSGAFLACASCHPEGGDDARVWRFGGIGARRTPAMNGDLLGTEPFHWDGDMGDLSHLVHDVFTGRMSGPELGVPQVGALGAWLDELPRPEPTIVDPDAVARGRTLFDTTAGCAACHSGGLFTNNASMDVGTGGTFQVPSLIGVSHRLPVMHDGCATTLRERFRAECGGAAHGNVAALTTEAQIQDLIAYLESL